MCRSSSWPISVFWICLYSEADKSFTFMQVWLSEISGFELFLKSGRNESCWKVFLFVRNLKFYLGLTRMEKKKFNPVYFSGCFSYLSKCAELLTMTRYLKHLKYFFFINWSKELSFSEEFPQINKIFETLKWSSSTVNELHLLICCGMYDHLSNASMTNEYKVSVFSLLSL